MKKKSTKIYSLLLALLLCFGAIFSNSTVSKAAEEEYITLLEEKGSAVANTEISYNFTLDMNTDVSFYLLVPAEVNCEVSLYDSTGELYGSSVINSTDLVWDDSMSAYYDFRTSSDMESGDYTVKLIFDTDTAYMFAAEAAKIQATINTKAVTLTAGFTEKLSVDNTSGKVSWTSSKKSVATVNSKGVVTAKKAGTATITAKTEDGQKLTCKITVKANVYKESKGSVQSLYYGNCAMQVYNASYAKNGDIVLKCRIANNSGNKITSLKNVKIVLTNDEGKRIGTYSVKSKSLSVKSGSSKDFTLTIKKSKLKIKKADLRNSSYSVDGSYVYYYYY